MNSRQIRQLLVLPIVVLSVPVATIFFGTGCEIAVDINAPLDGAVSDVLACGICADVSADANYDAADVSIYGLQPIDAGRDPDARANDAAANGKD